VISYIKLLLRGQNVKTAWVLFAKPPIQGKVKTRIGNLLGQDFALELYSKILSWQWQNLTDIKGFFSSKYKTKLYIYTAPPKHINLRKASSLLKKTEKVGKPVRVKFRLQTHGSLGNKLETAIGELLKTHDNVIIWGADIPLLHIEHFKMVIDQYPKASIIPATDGGYSLVSVSRQEYKPGIMQNIPWSTNKTLSTQLQRFDALDITYNLLDAVPDLDTPKDIIRNILFMKNHPHERYSERIKELAALLKSQRFTNM